MPHRVGHLFERIIERDNVVGAWEDYNRNRPRYRRRELDDAEIDSIAAELSTWTFDFGKPREKDIWEGGKIRHLKIPSFRSTIAQYAVFRVIGPIIDARLPEMSMSSRKGRGVRIAGIVVKPHGTNKLYRRTFRRMMAAMNRAFERPNERNLKSVMSYLGWLMATGRIRLVCDKIKKEKRKCRCTLILKLALTN